MASKTKPMVVVEVFKRFEYPKSMLDRYGFIDDAMMKARNDMQTMVNEIINDDHHDIHIDLFDYRVTEERGYRFRKPELEEDNHQNGDVVNISRAAKSMAAQDIEVKYGQLNHEQNPHLYEHEPEVKDERGRLLRAEAWYMRQDIENEMYGLYHSYCDKMRMAQRRA